MTASWEGPARQHNWVLLLGSCLKLLASLSLSFPT